MALARESWNQLFCAPAQALHSAFGRPAALHQTLTQTREGQGLPSPGQKVAMWGAQALAALLALAIGFYVFVYTIWLKRRTPQNIVIGGAAGAFPPMIGWAAVTGDVSLGGIALFALIFMWTPPHFWALALYKCDDYEKAGVPMLPVVSGVLETKRQMLLYTVLLLPVSLLPWWIGTASAAWGALATVFGLIFIGFAVKVWFDTTDRSPRQMFRFSLLYLSVLFAGLIVDNLVARFAGPTFGV